MLAIGAGLCWMGASYLGKAQDLGSYNPNVLEKVPIQPVPVGQDTHPYKQMPLARVTKKMPTRRVTLSAPLSFK